MVGAKLEPISEEAEKFMQGVEKAIGELQEDSN